MNYPQTNFVPDFGPGSDARVELKNGRFVDVLKGRYFDSGVTLMIQGARIVSLFHPREAGGTGKPDFSVDCGGKVVLPGLFNTHCHLTFTAPTSLPDFKDLRVIKAHREKQMDRNMAECLIHGITTVRDAYAEDLRRARRLRERISGREIHGPRFLQSVVVGPSGGYLLEKVSPVMRKVRSALGIDTISHSEPFSGGVEFPVDATEKQVRDAVNKAIDERGAEVIKIGEQKENMSNFKPTSAVMTQKQLHALADQARKRGRQSTIHQVSVASFRRAVAAGIDSLAHLPKDGVVSAEDIAACKAAGCMIDPTLSVSYDVSYRVKGDPLADDPDLALLTEFRNRVHESLVEEYWIGEFQPGARNFHRKAESGHLKVFGFLPMKSMFEYYIRGGIYGPRNLRLLFDGGVPFTASNDGGIPPCTPAMIQTEMDLFDLALNKGRTGTLFTGKDAIRMATINSARCLGLEKDLGTLEAGKIADLVFVDGDPFADPHVVGSRVAALFMDGRLVINHCGLKFENYFSKAVLGAGENNVDFPSKA